MHRNDRLWLVSCVILFVLSMFSYPMWQGFILGWPVNFVITLALSIVYCVFFALMIRERLNRKEG